MNIPSLQLSKYLLKSSDKIPTNTSIGCLVTPPTSPDTENPTNKRSLEDLNQSTTKKIKPNEQKLDLNLLDLYLSSKKSMLVKDDTYGLNLLCWACQCKSIEAMKKVLQQGEIDINERNGPNQLTALHIASAVNFFEGVDCLAQHPELDLNIQDKFGLTAVHYAAKHCKLDTLRILLEVGARTDIYDRYGKLAIHYAVRNSNITSVELILSKQGRNNPTLTNLIWSCKGRNKCAIEEAIIMAVGNPSDLLLKAFLKSGMFVLIESGGWWEEQYRDKKNSLIQLCIEWNRFECLRFLVINTDIPLCCDALELAVRQRKIDFVKYLCENVGISPCLKNGDNPSLLYAANHGFLDMIPYLITSDTSTDCIQQAVLFTRSIGRHKSFLDMLQKFWEKKKSQIP